MTTLAAALSAALLHFLWQGAVVATLLWVALWLLRHRPAEERYAATCLTLAILAALPLITVCWIYWAATPVSIILPMVAKPGASLPHASVPARGWWSVLLPLTLPVWLLGVLLLSARVAWGYAQMNALRRCGTPNAHIGRIAAEIAERMGVRKPISVLVSALPAGPGVIGWLSPVILGPCGGFSRPSSATAGIDSCP